MTDKCTVSSNPVSIALQRAKTCRLFGETANEDQRHIVALADEIERLQKDRNECLEAFHILFRIFPEPK